MAESEHSGGKVEDSSRSGDDHRVFVDSSGPQPCDLFFSRHRSRSGDGNTSPNVVSTFTWSKKETGFGHPQLSRHGPQGEARDRRQGLVRQGRGQGLQQV